MRTVKLMRQASSGKSFNVQLGQQALNVIDVRHGNGLP